MHSLYFNNKKIFNYIIYSFDIVIIKQYYINMTVITVRSEVSYGFSTNRGFFAGCKA